MRTSPRHLCAPLLTLAALSLGACGSDDDEGGGGQEGGSITIAYTSSPETFDPATDYTVEGLNALWTVYMGPVTYRHEEGAKGAELIPGLAEEMPRVSADGKTYTFTFRKGLNYSDGKALKASDFEHSLKRVFALESAGLNFYEGVEGADAFLKDPKPENDISGIEADDKTGKVTIKLKEPDARFMHILAMPFASVLPGNTPFENQTKKPAPGIGQFKVTKSVPNREIVLEKNAAFPEIPDVPAAKLDKITIKIVKDQRRQTQDVIRNKLDYMIDPPPADLLPEVREKYKDRYQEQVTNSTYYFWLNSELDPFKDKKVRQAVHTGLDKTAIARLFGGLLEPDCNFLPPGMEGYEKLDPCPFGDPEGGGDVDKAKQMIEEAGAAGAEITVWGNDEDPTQKVTENFADQLNSMGFKAKPKVIAGPVFFATVGNKKTKDLHAGFGNWFQDFPHPANFMFLVDGDTIQPTDNENWSNMNIPEVNEKIDALSKEPDLGAVADQWAELDRAVVEDAGVIPYGHRKLTTFMSERMDIDAAIYHPVYQDDFTSFALK